MYIVFDTDNDFEYVRSKYLLLELDTIEINLDVSATSYCVVDKDHISMNEISQLNEKRRLHEALMRNYRQRNWELCEQSITHLRGSFKGELDSFYDIMQDRVAKLKNIDLPDTWTGTIRSPNGSTVPC